MPDDYTFDLLAVNRDVVRLEEILTAHPPETQVRMLAQMMRLRAFCADFAQILRSANDAQAHVLRTICADFAQDLRVLCADFAQVEGGGKGGETPRISSSLNGRNVRQLPEKTDRTTAISAEGPDGFEEFWTLYPRKKDKNRAQRAFAHALRKACASAIIDGLRSQCASMRMRIAQGETQFIPHPTTWLNNERWADDPEPTSAVVSPATVRAVTAAQSWLSRANGAEAAPAPIAALGAAEELP